MSHSLVKRGVAWAVIAGLMLPLLPSPAAAELGSQVFATLHPPVPKDLRIRTMRDYRKANLQSEYERIIWTIKEEARKAAIQQPGNERTEQCIRAIRAAALRLRALEPQVSADFARTKARFSIVALPVMQQRATDAESQYHTAQTRLAGILARLDDADTRGLDDKRALALAELTDFFVRHQQRMRHESLRPNALPWVVDKKVGRTTMDAHNKTTDAVPSTATKSLLAPSSNDLVAGNDVQITPGIRSKAEELGGNPARIFQWVHDNICFIPTFGSMQGSELTLITKRGNAADISSLLIALLRASNIPAHYAIGTVEVPASLAMALVGGAGTAEAMVDILSQGGIPVSAVVAGGTIQAIRFEHIWVEAYIAYVPSRGERPGAPQTWIPMDASLKAVDNVPPVPLASSVSFDASAFVSAARGGSVVLADGSVAGIDQQATNAFLASYQAQVDQYLASLPEQTVGSVIGEQNIRPMGLSGIPGTLMGRIVSDVQRVASLPTSLQVRLDIVYYASDIDRAADTPSITYSASLSELAAKRIALSFVPTTTADQSIIDTAIANDDPSIPAYLISVTPTLTVEGTIIGTTLPTAIGASGFLTVRTTAPSYTSSKDYPITSGDLVALVLNPAGMTGDVLNARAQLENPMAMPQLDGAAETLFQVGLAWWAEKTSLNSVIASQLGVLEYQLPSHAVVSFPMSIQYALGVPQSAHYGVRRLDGREDLLAVSAKNGNQVLRQRFNTTAGMLGSYLESGVFEHAYFLKPGFSLSTATAINAAIEQGIPLYTITQANASAVMPNLGVDADVATDISNAVAAGLRVTIPQHDVSIADSQGTGYVVEDPTTGQAAYLISSGANGDQTKAMNSVTPIVEIPASPAVGVMLGAQLRDAGLDVVTKNGMIIAIGVTGASAALDSNGDPPSLNKILAAFTIVGLISTAYKTNIDKLYPQEPALPLRKYSTGKRAVLNWLTNAVRESSGQDMSAQNVVFLALTQDSVVEGQLGAPVSCPPFASQAPLLKQLYHLPDEEDAATGYVDLLFTRPSWYQLQQRVGLPGVEPGVTEILVTRGLIKVGDYSFLFFGLYATGVTGLDYCA